MATKISIANIARVSVGVVAGIWALLGLANALATGWGHGVDALVTSAVVVNVMLIVTSVLAIANARAWRVTVVIAMVAVTVDRVLSAVGTGDGLGAFASVTMLLAVIGITGVSRSQKM